MEPKKSTKKEMLGSQINTIGKIAQALTAVNPQLNQINPHMITLGKTTSRGSLSSVQQVTRMSHDKSHESLHGLNYHYPIPLHQF